MWPASLHINLAIRSLQQGKLIAYPTESVFGLGCDPNDLNAVENLLRIKSRSADKGLILIASDIEQLRSWVDFNQVPDLQPLTSSWPGHETWLVPVKEGISPLLSGKHDTLAVRVTAHPIAQQLCQQFEGAITSTSANIQGESEARDLLSVRKSFNTAIDYYVPGDTFGEQRPSRIRDAITGRVIRT